MSGKVTKCVCHDRDFADIKRYAENERLNSIEELQHRNYCSNSCRMCMAYVEMMLETGQTEFLPGEPYRTKRSD